MLQLLDVALFNPLHHFAPAEEVGAEVGGQLAGHNVELVVGSLVEGNGTSCRNEVGAPLVDKPKIPENKAGQCGRSKRKSDAGTSEERGESLQQKGEPEYEKWRQGKKEAIPKRRNPCPIRVKGDEEIESQAGGQNGHADPRDADRKQNQTNNREGQNRGPRQQAVVGGKQDAEEYGIAPEEVSQRRIPGLKGSTVDDPARRKSRNHDQEDDEGKKKMPAKKLGKGGRSLAARLKNMGILWQCLDEKNYHDHEICVVNIEHQTGDQSEKDPLP